MFEDKYRNDNQKISADQPLKAYIKNKMARQAQKQKQSPKRFLKSAIALSLCICLCFGAVFVHNKIAEQKILDSLISNNQSDILNQQAVKPVNYGEVYLLAKKQYDGTKINWFINTQNTTTDEAWEEESVEMEAPTPTDDGTLDFGTYDNFVDYSQSYSDNASKDISFGDSHYEPNSITSRVTSSSAAISSKPSYTTSKVEHSAENASSSMQASSEQVQTSEIPSSAPEQTNTYSEATTSNDVTSADVTSEDISSEVVTSGEVSSEVVTSESVSSESVSSGETSSKPTSSTPTSSNTQHPDETEKEDPNDYSGTNVQVTGVDEGDIIKTDGKYIYTLSLKNATFTITKANKGNLTVISTTSVEGADFYTGSGAEMYILGEKVVIVSSVYVKIDTELKYSHAERSRVDIFNCANKENPVLEKTFEQDGIVHSSRLIDSKLYLISRQGALYAKPEEDKLETYIPCTYDGDTFSTVAEDSLYLAADYSSYGYVIISSYDIQDAVKVDSLAVMGSCETMYMSTSSLYICANKHDGTTSYTLLSRFAIDKGDVELKSLGAVTGTVLNQFSLDEYDGNLRLVVTIDTQQAIKEDIQRYTASGSIVKDTVTYYISDSVNALYVLNSDLDTIGAINGIAEGERIYSARFMGKTAYFVTFRQTDPLYSVDLSDPKSPKILGALKIPGFSEYLHPFGSNLLFGFGQDADEKSGATMGLKLSMFNISDPANVKEQNTLKLYDKYSIAESNHKAFLISASKNLIAFPGQNSFLVYSYSTKNGFIKKAEIAFNGWDQYSRMVYIGNYIYIYTDSSTITSLSMTGFTQVDKVTF